ncbi:bifunctional diaminohydroxyphosphoribosylaminopyrimidine deaminase/5-amino-6-(5-phosphoribosylamino)uracil reductase RibD [Seongchinamella sediminis]|uniref:Riboflavin biosynthesis protein RibD n=1 Tax=Seongchinamella sediminis TaxID=2283635 RepID=A0A3L7DYB1_9GAMM|nr:bifunctional diaminohydroxyphosphoribosylaminopyrimidine deaminase/5-amino-6-(5-phosphoribosylamino)uracil reductase RibD [Seongchinamella sediminis]RLQ22234.1 bifunctional diaminohydroxyphosphoribosylaminopyrimidine deaminase/5-amino-6-(5-phosphoribosylamino)uracil reductase RibD [Seongchinamella sediminis]
MPTELDTRMMARALQLARRGQYSAMPNPHVGCVLVRDGQVIGEGFTRPAGGNHAEIEALQAAGDAQGATAYVTLEPCSHTGKTGPCADALVAAGVSRVVVAMEDPNPQVAGAGLAKLRAAGLQVEVGLLAADAGRVIPGFIARMSRGRGRVRAKLAMSLDGRTAMASGESQWITGPAARADVQRLRAMSCALVTGIGTILADDCSLTVRAGELDLPPAEAALASQKQPLRVVLDSRLQTPPGAKVLDRSAPTLLCRDAALPASTDIAAAGAEQLALQRGAAGLDLAALLAELGARQSNEILVECGPRLAGAFLQAGLLDEIIVYMAPVLMGSAARPLLELPLERMADKVPLAIADMRRVGEDWRITAIPRYRG